MATPAHEGLAAFVKAVRADPSLLHKPELGFFRDYLVELGATIPGAGEAKVDEGKEEEEDPGRVAADSEPFPDLPF